jgi:hypothetical protein
MESWTMRISHSPVWDERLAVLGRADAHSWLVDVDVQAARIQKSTFVWAPGEFSNLALAA